MYTSHARKCKAINRENYRLNSFVWIFSVLYMNANEKNKVVEPNKQYLFSRVEQISIYFAIEAACKLISVGKGMLNVSNLLPLIYI